MFLIDDGNRLSTGNEVELSAIDRVALPGDKEATRGSLSSTTRITYWLI